jgi:hypothetical protein
MIRRSSCYVFFLVVPLLPGQDCAGPAATVHPGVPSAIPAGEYSGQVETVTRLLVGTSIQDEETAIADQAQSFGDAGEALGKDDAPLYVGYEETRSIAGMDITLTVVSIEPAAGTVTINYTAGLSLKVGTSTYKMSGTGQANFTLVSAGSIDYELELDLSYAGATGSTVALQLDSAGTLYR